MNKIERKICKVWFEFIIENKYVPISYFIINDSKCKRVLIDFNKNQTP